MDIVVLWPQRQRVLLRGKSYGFSTVIHHGSMRSSVRITNVLVHVVCECEMSVGHPEISVR